MPIAHIHIVFLVDIVVFILVLIVNVIVVIIDVIVVVLVVVVVVRFVLTFSILLFEWPYRIRLSLFLSNQFQIFKF